MRMFYVSASPLAGPCLPSPVLPAFMSPSPIRFTLKNLLPFFPFRDFLLYGWCSLDLSGVVYFSSLGRVPISVFQVKLFLSRSLTGAQFSGVCLVSPAQNKIKWALARPCSTQLLPRSEAWLMHSAENRKESDPPGVGDTVLGGCCLILGCRSRAWGAGPPSLSLIALHLQPRRGTAPNKGPFLPGLCFDSLRLHSASLPFITLTWAA